MHLIYEVMYVFVLTSYRIYGKCLYDLQTGYGKLPFRHGAHLARLLRLVSRRCSGCCILNV